jgi:hypothetical protein
MLILKEMKWPEIGVRFLQKSQMFCAGNWGFGNIGMGYHKAFDIETI